MPRYTGRDPHQTPDGFGNYVDADTGQVGEDVCRYLAVFDGSISVICGRPLIERDQPVLAPVRKSASAWPSLPEGPV